MSFNTWAIALALATSGWCADAAAVHVHGRFEAVVTATDGTLTGVAVGDVFEGGFFYDTATQYAWDTSRPWNNYFLSDGRMWIDVGGHHATGDGLSVDVTNDVGEGVQDSVTFDTRPLTLDDAEIPLGFLWFSLTTRPGSAGALADSSLPTSYDIGAWDQWREGQLVRDNGWNTPTIMDFEVTYVAAVTSVPEPATYGLMFAGLALLSAARRPAARRTTTPAR